MGENSSIQWTTHTFNPWIGCQRVSPGCTNCYAEALDKRWGGALVDGVKTLRWGPKAPRVRTSPANWRKPLTWNKAAEKAGERHRVFCSSLADVFEDRPELVSWRLELLDLIRRTPHLDWLLLTKRPQDIRRLLEESCASQHGGHADYETATTDWVDAWLVGETPSNVWLGTTVEDQQRANERIPHLLSVPAVVRFLSCEPLIERVTLPRLCLCGCGKTEAEALAEPSPLNREQREADMRVGLGIDWVIIGGESGHGARPFMIDWARDLVRQCRSAGAAPFVKQLGARPTNSTTDLHLHDSAGGDMAEWPADLRVREFPATARRD